jgi:hypothetical protein
MRPTVGKVTKRLAVIEEEPLAPHTLVGSIEVEALTDQDGSVIHNIALAPPDNDEEVELLVVRRQPSQEIFDESVEVVPSMIDNITSSLFSCVGYESENLPKSALRKSSSILTTSSMKLDDDPATNSVHRVVSFGRLQINEFKMTLGDHPSATSGPPVALDWDRQAQTREFDVDEYERARLPRRKRRQLKIPCRDRRSLLETDAGFSEVQVNQAWAEALQIRKQRQETLQRGLILMTLDDAWESASRKYRRMTDTVARAVGL